MTEHGESSEERGGRVIEAACAVVMMRSGDQAIADNETHGLMLAAALFTAHPGLLADVAAFVETAHEALGAVGAGARENVAAAVAAVAEWAYMGGER